MRVARTEIAASDEVRYLLEVALEELAIGATDEAAQAIAAALRWVGST